MNHNFRPCWKTVRLSKNCEYCLTTCYSNVNFTFDAAVYRSLKIMTINRHKLTRCLIWRIYVKCGTREKCCQATFNSHKTNRFNAEFFQIDSPSAIRQKLMTFLFSFYTLLAGLRDLSVNDELDVIADMMTSCSWAIESSDFKAAVIEPTRWIWQRPHLHEESETMTVSRRHDDLQDVEPIDVPTLIDGNKQQTGGFLHRWSHHDRIIGSSRHRLRHRTVSHNASSQASSRASCRNDCSSTWIPFKLGLAIRRWSQLSVLQNPTLITGATQRDRQKKSEMKPVHNRVGIYQPDRLKQA